MKSKQALRKPRANFLQVAVVGAAECDQKLSQTAFEVGRLLALARARILTGGRGGVMEAASAGAASAGGEPIGILPGADAAVSPPNSSVQVALFTGLGQARNQVIVLSSDAVVAIGGGWGTLSEIALALKHGIPVIVLESWSLDRPDGEPEPLLHQAASAEDAVELALLRGRRRKA